MRLALVLVGVAAVLVTHGPVVRGQDRAQDISAVVVPLAERESAAFVKAFNDRKLKDLAALFTSDADFAFLQGPSIEKLQYGIGYGREQIVGGIVTFCSAFPDVKLSQTVLSARLIRPDLLISEADFELKGLRGDSGPIKGRAVTIRVLESGAWKIAAERGFSNTRMIGNVVWGQGPSAAVLPLAKRESAAYVKAFNDRALKDLPGLFASDAEVAFLQGSSVEKLQYGLVDGREDIMGCHEMFFSVFPDAKLTRSVLSARLIRPDMLIAEADFEIKGLPADTGPIQGRAVSVHVLESGAWKIAAERSFSRIPVIK